VKLYSRMAGELCCPPTKTLKEIKDGNYIACAKKRENCAKFSFREE